MSESKSRVDAFTVLQDTQDVAHSTPSSGARRGAADPAALLRPPEADGEIGRLGGFRVRSLVGRGGMGAVFAAEDPLLNRPVALKVMRPELITQPDARERFLREARAAAAIEHDNITPVYQVGEDNGVLFLAMPLLKGGTLQDRLRDGERLPVGAALKVAWEVAAGLAAAHAAGLIHRDIKPGNLWLDAGDGPHGFRKVRILDFGLARLGSGDAHLTGDAVVGTPAYMAPEQARGKPVDARTDLFSLGGVLYRCLTGRQPFLGSNAYEVLTSLAVEEPPPVRELNPEVPEPLSALIHELLAKSADARPQSAVEVLDRLRAIARELAAPRPAGQPRVVYVPVQVATLPEISPFADIDASDTELTSDGPDEPDEPTDAEPVPPQPRRWGVALAAVLVAAVAAVAGVIVVKVKGPDGKETEVRVPEGSKVDVDEKGNVTVSLPRTLPIAPMPREADPPELEFRLKAGESAVHTFALFKDGSKFVAGYGDGHLRVWNLTTRKLESEHAIGDMIWSLAIHPDGKTVAISTDRGWLLTWNLDTGKEVRRFTTPSITLPSFLSIGFVDDGKLLVAPVGKLGLLLGWNITTGEIEHLGKFPTGEQASHCPHPSGDAIFVGSTGTHPQLLKVATGERVWEAPWDMAATIPGITADGERAGFSSRGGTVAVCSRNKPEPLAVFHGPSDKWYHTTFSPNGQLLAATGAGGEVCVWAMAGGQAPVRVWRERDGRLADRVAFTPDGERLVVSYTGGTVCVYHVQKSWGEPRKPYPPLDPAWLKRVHKLPADEQVKEVSTELVRRNPGFNGELFTDGQQFGRIHHVGFSTNEVEDIMPVRGFPHLTLVRIEGSNGQRGKLWDLSPLGGMKLTGLYARSNPIRDLSPLRGMPLEQLLVDSSLVTDLSPLKGMQLGNFGACNTPVRDISPLAGMPLKNVWLHSTEVTDLSPLKGAPLKFASLPASALTAGWLTELPLENLEVFAPDEAKRSAEYLRTLRAMKLLKQIDGKPVAEFWKEIDAMPPEKKP